VTELTINLDQQQEATQAMLAEKSAVITALQEVKALHQPNGFLPHFCRMSPVETQPVFACCVCVDGEC
jgi:hypothetical protein